MINAGRLEGLQVARALAALTVAYYHSFAIFSGWPDAALFPIPGLKQHGYLGVNFFFAVSGYVISLVCDKGNFSPREFLAKRFFRLYPVYWCVVLAALLLKLLGVSFHRDPGIAALLYSLTLLPHPEGTDSLMIIPVAWSLEFEVMFYLLAALIVPFLRLWGLAAVLLGLICWAYAAPPEVFTFHLVRTLNSDFLAGVLAYLLRRPLSHIPSLVLIPCGLIGYYCAVVLLIPFSGSLGGLLAVSALANATCRWNRWPLRWLIRMGDASYSMYLLHWVMIYVFVTVIGKIGVPPAWSAEPIRLCYLSACCWLSFQAFRYIERPMIEWGNRLVQGRRWSAAPVPRLTR